MGRIHEKAGRALVAAVVLLSLFACTEEPTTSVGRMLDVTVKDFRIRPSSSAIEDGLVTLRVWNEGPTTHEFVAIRSDLHADELPIGADGLSVDEDRVVPLDELEEVEAGASGELTLALTPGRLVLFCNLEGHYLTGMYASLEVANDA